MTQISSTFETAWLTPRTANYVAALIREGDGFDYYKWLQRVRGREAQAKECVQPVFPTNVPEVIKTPVDYREPSAKARLFNGRAPCPHGMTSARRKTLRSTSATRITRRLEKVRDAWDVFQASRARDAVYGYLDAVFAIVTRYKMRGRVTRLLRRAFEFADLSLDKKVDVFTGIIRCTCNDYADNKTISKWARALRYVARCKVPTTRVKAFMKETGGVNACADRYAKNTRWTGR
jgi:hypothetical protein